MDEIDRFKYKIKIFHFLFLRNKILLQPIQKDRIRRNLCKSFIDRGEEEEESCIARSNIATRKNILGGEAMIDHLADRSGSRVSLGCSIVRDSG